MFLVGLLLTCHMECGPCGSPGMLGVCLWLGYTQGCWHIPYLCSKMHLFQYVPAQSTNNAAATCRGRGDLWPKVLQPAKTRGYFTACSAHRVLRALLQTIVEGVLLYPTAKALYRWINLLMCPSPQNESSIKQFYYIFANTSSVSVIHIKKLHLIIKHTICTGHLRETG